MKMGWIFFIVTAFIALLSASCQPAAQQDAPPNSPTGSENRRDELTSAAAYSGYFEKSSVTSIDEPLPSSTREISTAPKRLEVEADIRLQTSKSTFSIGERVDSEILNLSDSAIMYNYGCSWPLPSLIEDGAAIPLLVSIYEEVPGPYSLGPRQSQSCFWDQQAWQEPVVQGSERYRSYKESASVPPGDYQLMVEYYWEPYDIYVPSAAAVAWSNIFSIEE